MKENAISLDHGNLIEPSLQLAFEDPADLLEVITPARVRLLREISTEPMTLSADNVRLTYGRPNFDDGAAELADGPHNDPTRLLLQTGQHLRDHYMLQGIEQAARY